jgi:hypothetical protein
MPDSRELSQSECEALLRAGVTGRVALSTPTGPQIVPLNYSVVDSAIVLRTSAYSLLGTYGRGTTVAFEVDHFDHSNQRGWSVVARGRADVVEDPAELDHIRAVWEPRPWASGARGLFLRVRWTELTGRQLGNGWQPMLDLPYRRVV